MYGEVFIAWGGNRALADRVGAELKARDVQYQVGGEDNDPGESSSYLSVEVLNLMKRASQAIILAQRVRHGHLRDDEVSPFQPNLMFEWGYLSAKLPPASLHVFLIGIEKGDLPSDLQGRWCEEIGWKNVESTASEIAQRFVFRKETYCRSSPEPA